MSNQKKKTKKHETFQSLIFAFKLMSKAAPMFFPLALISSTANTVFNGFVKNVLFLRTMLGIVTQGGTFREFALTLLLFCLGGAAANMCDCAGDYIALVQAKVAYKNLNKIIFEKASAADMKNFDNPDFFDNYKRASQVVTEDRSSQLIYAAAYMLGDCVSAVITIIYVASIDKKALIVLIAAAASFVFRRKARLFEYEKRNALTPGNREKDYVRRVIFLRDWAKDIRTSSIFSVLRKRFDGAVERNRKIIEKYGKKIAFFTLIGSLLSQAVPIAGSYMYAAYKFVNHSLSVADFSVLMTAIMQIKDAINVFADTSTSVLSNAMYFGNFKKFLEYGNTDPKGSAQCEEIENIEFKNVSFAYPGSEKPTLENVSLCVKKGETVAIVGKNGAGKSTFVKLLLGFYEPTHGSVLINGRNIEEYDAASLRKRIGTVFQDYKVFALSVNENVLCRECLDESDRKIAENALKDSGAFDRVSRLENGAQTVLTREFDPAGTGLSGGEQQKVAAARMFAHAFDAAVLDEPSSALDPIAEYKMYESLIKETRGKAVIYISHRLSSASLSDRIYVFENGRTVQCGSHEKLIAEPGIYKQMFHMQASSYTDAGISGKNKEAAKENE